MDQTEKPHPGKLFDRIGSHVVGRQYHEHGAAITSGCPLIFERDPENQYDKNAIRVKNEACQMVGHVPRKQAAWLAPLIDAGLIRIEGEARTNPIPPEISWPCLSYLSIYLTAKGEAVFQKASPNSQAEMVHQMMLDAYRQLVELHNVDQVRWLLDILEQSLPQQQKVLPETWLVFALIQTKASEFMTATVRSSNQLLAECLNQVELGEPHFFEAWTFYPLSWPEEHVPKSNETIEYLLLDDALKSGMATLEELNDNGQVNSIRLSSLGRIPILVPEGDVLVGAKQNRVTNITVLLGPGEVVELPVSCVEQGRWSQSTSAFESRYLAPASLRASKLRSIYAHYEHGPNAKRESDQGKVWKGVAECLRKVGVKSATFSLPEGLDVMEERCKQIRSAVFLPASTSGIVVMYNNQIQQVELFSSPAPFHKTWRKLLPPILLDKATEPPVDVLFDAKANARQIRSFWTRLVDSATASLAPCGHGIEIAMNSPKVTGTALMYNNQLLHLSAFPVAVSVLEK